MPTKLTVKLKQLFFDPENPRFVAGFGDDSSKMFRYLITDIGVDDLLQSISASGLIDGDPVIVRDKGKNQEGEDEYFVIEGNRRLAALKLFVGERPQDDIPLPDIPEIAPEHLEQIQGMIQVQSDWSPELLQAYLGYKHVTASKEWPPEAKAKFVFDRAGGDFSKENLTKFAKTLGTTYPTLRRWLIAFLTLKQAEDKDLFDPTSVPTKRYFGTFYTLLGGSEAKRFLGLTDDPISETPVPEERLDALGKFLKWTIGTKDKAQEVNSRQQAKFEQVLASPKALAYFEVKGDLETSLMYTEYNADEVAGKLQEATYTVEECLPKLNDVRETPSVVDAFFNFERAYKKARLNMRGDDEPENPKHQDG
ncbi:MAG: ParB N-terminal domain-containing protein [Pyrinomonadaceae bacterium]